jgi:hypothetical protein
MSKEILRPQKAQPVLVPLAHIVGEIDHMGKVWTPAAQPAQQEPIDLVRAIEYADARWSGVDVPIEWARHFAEGIRRTEAAHGIKENT